MSKSALATTLLTIGVFFWGCSFSFVKESVGLVDVYSFLFMLAAGVMAVLSVGRLRFLDWDVIIKGLVAGGLLAVSFITQTLGVLHTTATNAAFITGLCVVIVPIIISVMDRRLPSALKVFAITIAFVGLGLITLKSGFRLGVGDSLLLFCAVGFAVHLILINRYVGEVEPLLFSMVQFFVIAIVAGAAGYAFNGKIVISGELVVWKGVIFCAVFASAFIYTVQARYQRYISEMKAAIIYSLEPLFAAVAAWFYLAEALTFKTGVGGLMIIAGAILVDAGANEKRQ